ncbi:PKD domain-containing protein [Nocardioides sp. TRM66260-LWL]|uniref:PKD domain-containing protein n=1 Tax=Nocardioides sp. TRM66260-LWL TaxID=2874478 RepID=UPI001CC3889F|nr:PKD domain-containing protein [Nocardioides sp. TRM66260-LWL]MBZ5734700.1 PKD domain-containing protein [Nocardioides sp. TRM66260-LWL]
MDALFRGRNEVYLVHMVPPRDPRRRRGALTVLITFLLIASSWIFAPPSQALDPDIQEAPREVVAGVPATYSGFCYPDTDQGALWYVDGTFVASGPRVQLTFTEGGHTVTLTGIDESSEESCSADITVQARKADAPTVSIAKPAAITDGNPATIKATATTQLNGVTYQWSVNGFDVRDATAASLRVLLRQGRHTIGVTVTQPDGQTATAERTVEVRYSSEMPQQPVDTIQVTPYSASTRATLPSAGTVRLYLHDAKGTLLASSKSMTVRKYGRAAVSLDFTKAGKSVFSRTNPPGLTVRVVFVPTGGQAVVRTHPVRAIRALS